MTMRRLCKHGNISETPQNYANFLFVFLLVSDRDSFTSGTVRDICLFIPKPSTHFTVDILEKSSIIFHNCSKKDVSFKMKLRKNIATITSCPPHVLES